MYIYHLWKIESNQHTEIKDKICRLSNSKFAFHVLLPSRLCYPLMLRMKGGLILFTQRVARTFLLIFFLTEAWSWSQIPFLCLFLFPFVKKLLWLMNTQRSPQGKTKRVKLETTSFEIARPLILLIISIVIIIMILDEGESLVQ